MYAEIRSQETLTAALALAKGCYQRDILLGVEALSGATLRGAARNWGGRYRRSAQSILRRCQDAGLAVREEIQDHGRRTVVIG